MPIFETSTGQRMDLMLPHDTPWPELNEAVTQYDDLLRERRAAAHRLDALMDEKEAAVRRDLEALKQAILDAKPDPGPKHEEKVKKETEAAKRRLDALELAILDAEQTLVAVIDQHRDDWIAAIAADEASRREAYSAAVTALSETRQTFSRARTMRAWLTTFPERPAFRDPVPAVRTLTAPHGDAYLWDQVVQALAEEASPPPAPVVIPFGAAAHEMLRQSHENA